MLLVFLVAFSTGVGMLLSVLFVRYRDMQPIWDVASQMLFYASPVLYVATMVPESVRTVYLFNPIAAVLVQVRHAIVDPTAPSLATLMGSGALVLVPAAVALAVLALGLWAFNRAAATIAENL